MKLRRALLTAGLGVFATVGISQAGIIDGWNKDLVVTDPGPYVDFTTYYSTIYTDASMTTSNGVVAWKHGDVQPDGLKVVNGDDVDGSNCLMTTGYNPYDLSDKQCTDPLQSSKRIKLKNTVNAPVDVNLSVVDGPTSIYRMLQKLTDATDVRWSGFDIKLGFTVNGEFVASTAGDGLGFSDTRGSYFTRPTTTYSSKEDTLSALYAQGLAGPADKYHPETGYFNITDRFSFGMIATEDTIVSDGISATYSDVFGEWNNSSGVPIAILWDDDGNINTDNILMANCAAADINVAGTHSGDDAGGFTCDNNWVTYRSEAGLDSNGLPYPSDGSPMVIQLSDLASVVYTSKDAAVESGNPAPFYMDYVEDLANLGLNFWITVEDNTAWPTPNNFTIRYTPVPSGGTTPPPADEEETICTDGLDNDSDGLTDCADPDCAGIDICGPEGRDVTCTDGYDNDGDGDIDCADAGCAKNKACR